MRSNIIFKDDNKNCWNTQRIIYCVISYENGFTPVLRISTDDGTIMKI